jgi:polyhydroxybutyrate depolymerase
MKIISVALLLCLPLLLFGQQTIYDSIYVGGLQRQYILYVPASYHPGTPAPLVLNFHGYTSNAYEQMFYGDFRPIADTAGFIVVHPMGTIDIVGNTHWNVGWGLSQVDDVGFTNALIDSLSASYNINPERIYSTGMSNGGFMSYTLACELSDRIAAIASVTGDLNVNQLTTCNPQHPMPVMEIHGTADPTVAYDGNILFAPIPTTLNFWANFNSCETPPTITSIPDVDTADGCTAEHQLYPNGNNGVVVEHYKIINGVHAWPGSAFGGAGTNQDIDASKEIWRFFSQYDIHGLINPTATQEPAKSNSISVYPNPARSTITVVQESIVPVYYTIMNMMGQEMMAGNTTGQREDISIEALPSGMYILTFDQKAILFSKQ